jgi:hypothetical protein
LLANLHKPAAAPAVETAPFRTRETARVLSEKFSRVA